MQIKRVRAVYFSGTGTTEKTVRRIAAQAAAELNAEVSAVDFTPPQIRQETLHFGPEELVILGMPTYAGRVPNVLLPFLKERVRGGGALCAAVVLFGNRSFDDSLIELRDILCADGFAVIGGAAFVGEHSFSRTLGVGRPDAADEVQMDEFARGLARKAQELSAVPAEPIRVRGEEPIRPYYTPRDRAGNSINILKVRPRTDLARCSGCGLCARLCPMGSIDPAHPEEVRGICIKCCACVKKCPAGAKYFDDPGYLYHQHELEEEYARRAENACFL